MMCNLPESFLNRMKLILNQDFDHFISAYEGSAIQSIRLNPKKETDEFDDLKTVKWYENGKFLKEKRQFITDPLWHAGVYYVQEASSMILAEVFNQLYPNDSPKNALDLCAAPGGKSTLLQSLINENTVLTANEVIKSRVQILKENHIRLGNSGNLIITQNDPKDFKSLTEFYDYIQIDAPCSGEGMFRKDEVALKQWSEANCQLCVERQKRILADIFPALAKDSFLVYSTCTFNPNENEKLMDWVCKAFDFESIQINFKPEWKIKEVNYNGVFGYYFYPHLVESEGLFIAILKKNSGFGLNFPKLVKMGKTLIEPHLIEDENIFLKNGIFYWESPELSAIKSVLAKKLNIVYSGIELGEKKGKDFIPSQAMANFHKNLHYFPRVEVDKNQALDFLRGKDPNLNLEKNGIYLLTYQGFGLGWVKFIGNRSNNYYPKPWRIKNY